MNYDQIRLLLALPFCHLLNYENLTESACCWCVEDVGIAAPHAPPMNPD